MSILNNLTTIYVGKKAFLSELCQELHEPIIVKEDLIFATQTSSKVTFALDRWDNPQVCHFTSIKNAATILRSAGKYWYLHPLNHVRRSHLIAEQLLKCPNLTRSFPMENPLPLVGVFFLWDEHTLVYSTTRWKRWPDGHCQWVEDKINPPNRAYLKLWEAFSLLNRYPKPGDSAIDLGASPGGWTYVLQSLKSHVLAIDKAPLAQSIECSPYVSYLKQSAFAFDPMKVDKTYDWVLSDIACYPERAFHLITRWIASKKAKQMIFTIKFQGETQMDVLKQLKEIPGASIHHLFHNKHEATFFYPQLPDASF